MALHGKLREIIFYCPWEIMFNSPWEIIFNSPRGIFLILHEKLYLIRHGKLYLIRHGKLSIKGDCVCITIMGSCVCKNGKLCLDNNTYPYLCIHDYDDYVYEWVIIFLFSVSMGNYIWCSLLKGVLSVLWLFFCFFLWCTVQHYPYHLIGTTGPLSFGVPARHYGKLVSARQTLLWETIFDTHIQGIICWPYIGKMTIPTRNSIGNLEENSQSVPNSSMANFIVFGPVY